MSLLDTIKANLNADITARTGIRTLSHEELEKCVSDLIDGNTSALPLPFARATLQNIGQGFDENIRFTATLADGSLVTIPYDIDHIALRFGLEVAAYDATNEKTDNTIAVIQSAYATPQGVAMPGLFTECIPLANIQLSQVRVMPTHIDSPDLYGGAISLENTYAIIAVPFPADSLRIPLDDHFQALFLLSIWHCYEEILSKDIVGALKYFYDKINGGGQSKKGLFSKMLASSPVGDFLGTGNSYDEKLARFASDLQNGTLDRESFEKAYASALYVVPDLYDRVVSRQPFDTVLAVVTARIGQIQQRCKMLGDALGVDSRADSNYQPRSAEAVEVYFHTLLLNSDATMQDAFEAYDQLIETRAANEEQVTNMYTELITSTIDKHTGGKFSKIMEISKLQGRQ